MSSVLAIAAVTDAIRRRLDGAIHSPEPRDPAPSAKEVIFVSAKPPDELKETTGPALNVFLYQVTANPHLSNMLMPGSEGDLATPPLALKLHYLLTAYGTDNELTSQRLIGRAVTAIHRNPVFLPADFAAGIAGSGLADQIDRVRITPMAVSTEELSRFWSTFGAPYRLSVAYEASVVLIEPARTERAALPVLTRGRVAGAPGPWSFASVAASLSPGSPGIDEVVLEEEMTIGGTTVRKRVPRARPGAYVRVRGHGLASGGGIGISLAFASSRLDSPNVLPVTTSTEAEAEARIPLAPGTQWPAGIYSVAAMMSQTGIPDRSTAALPFALAPTISLSHVATSVGPDLYDVTITVDVAPDVQPGQRVSLFVGDRELVSESASPLTFLAPSVPKGKHFVRLRVDGIESLLVRDYSSTPLEFDPTQAIDVP